MSGPDSRCPEVSVVIAAHNYGRFLTEAVRSVQAQTFSDWECLIVDDASHDETPALGEELAAGDPRVRYLRQETNRGEARTRNAGNHVARGRYVAPLDADDWWAPEKLERQLAALAARPRSVLCCTGRIPSSPVQRRLEEYLRKWSGDLDRGLREENNILHSSALVRRDALQAVGGYDETLPYAVDWDLWLRLLERYGAEGLVYVPEPLVYYRVHEASMSRDWRRTCRGMRAVTRRHLLRRGWALRKPAAAWRVLDAELDRELRLLLEADQRGRAALVGLQWVLLSPLRRWRWKRLLSALHRPAPPSHCVDARLP